MIANVSLSVPKERLRRPRSVGLLLTVILGVAISVGCTGNNTWGSSSRNFINKTSLDEAQFQSLAQQRWKEAQEAIATEVQYDLEGNVVSIPDAETAAAARALQPRGVVIRGISEVPAGELNKLPSCVHCPYKDPTGIIYCPSGNSINAKYCDAYLSNYCEIVVPKSKPEYMGLYEMENCILYFIGHDPQNRVAKNPVDDSR